METRMLPLRTMLAILSCWLFFLAASSSQAETVILNTPLTGSVHVDCASEVVDFTGSVRLVVDIEFPPEAMMPPQPRRIDAELVDVTGKGQSSGMTYLLTGRFRVVDIDNWATYDSYNKRPPATKTSICQLQCPVDQSHYAKSCSLPVTLTVSFDSKGAVTNPAATFAQSGAKQEENYHYNYHSVDSLG